MYTSSVDYLAVNMNNNMKLRHRNEGWSMLQL